MKRLVKLPTIVERADVLFGTRPVSARSPLNHRRDARANGSKIRTHRQALILAGLTARGPPPLFALSSGTTGAGAGEDPEEEQRPLEDGSHVRPNINARLLLQLDDLVDHTAAPVLASAIVAATDVGDRFCVRVG